MQPDVQRQKPVMDSRVKQRYSCTKERIACALCIAAAIILCLLALAKAAMLVSHFGQFSGRNVFLLVVPNWIALSASVAVELVAAAGILQSLRAPRKAGLWLLWLCTLIAIYRSGMMLFSPHGSCHCLGIVGISVGSAGRNETAISLGIWLGLTAMAATILILSRRSQRVATAPARLHLSVVTFVLGMAVGDARAAVQISGEIASDYYLPNGRQINHALSRFSVVRGDSHWRITTEQAGSESISITSDGNATFTIISATNDSSPRVAVARGLTNVNVTGDMQTGIVDPWNFPIFTPAESLPWWFLVLSKDTNLRFSDLPTPWTLPRSDPQAYFCSNVIGWAEAQPKLLATVAFYYSKENIQTAFDSPVLNKQAAPLVSSDDARMLVAVLKDCTNVVKAGHASVLDWTNSSHGRYPLRFECVVFDSLAEQLYDRNSKSFRADYAGRAPTVRIRYYGTVKSIEEVADVAFPPVLYRPTWVADNRLGDARSKVQRLEYGPVETWISDPSRIETEAGPDFKVVTIKMAPEQAPSWMRWVLALMFLVALGFPLLLMRLRKGKKV
jgi:hypothetical protein